MDQEEALKSPPSIKRPFRELPALWLRIWRMSESFFSSELPRTSIPNTFFSVLLVTGCTAILTVIESLIASIIGYTNVPAGANPARAMSIAASLAVLFTCLAIVVIPLSFYLDNGIAFISALIFGGKGKYSSQTYLDSLYYVPLGILGGLIGPLSAIPKAGIFIVAIVTLGIVIYAVMLRIRVFKMVHDFGTAKATLAVLAPWVLLLIPACIIVVLMLKGLAIGEMFSTINSQLGTPTP